MDTQWHNCSNRHSGLLIDTVFYSVTLLTVKLQWLEHLSDNGNLFEICTSIYRGPIMATGQEAKSDNSGKSFRFLQNNCMLCVCTH